MSYEIDLFDRSFLKLAIEKHLGDWTGAPPLPTTAVTYIISAAIASGFQAIVPDDKFVAFLRERGSEPPQEFVIDSSDLRAQLYVYAGQVTFEIPFSERCDASIRECARIASAAAEEFGLGYHDPQLGVAR